MRLLAECAKTGDWLCLKNLHLVVAWQGLLLIMSHLPTLNILLLHRAYESNHGRFNWAPSRGLNGGF